uniref:uncharacterized protein LOC120328642 n=1 Tax=Styela clava TaxID=7725 RepID=UPI00193A4C22|nr:uncharacterized protein LOC120328642 [Styela clava]
MDSLQSTGSLKRTLQKIRDFNFSETEFYDVSQETNLLKPLEVQELPQLTETTFDVSKKLVTFHQNISGDDGCSYPVISKIFEDFDKGRISFVGQAGCGKTTLLKIVSREIMDKKIPSLIDVDLLFFLNCQNFDPEINVTLEELVFQNIKLDEEEKISILKRIKQHPSKCLFVLDAPDILDYTSCNCGKKITKGEKCQPAKILLQLIRGKLFPRCRVITSERYFNPDDSEPQKVIALSGLSRNSIEKIAIGYLGKMEGIRMLQNLQTRSPSLLSLCSIPVFLTYTIIGMKSNFKPSTMSGVMVNLLQSFVRSKNILNSNMNDIFERLKPLSYTGIQKNKAIFNSQDLKRHRLTFKETGDFTSLKGLVQVFKDQQLIHFNHFSIQMFLAAMFVAELPINEFRQTVIEMFDNSQQSSILRIIFGLILDDEVTEASQGLLEVQDQLEEKRKFLRQIVRSRIQSVGGIISDLNFLACIHEAKKGIHDLIKMHIHSLKIENTSYPLTPNDAYIIGSIAQNCDGIQSLSVMRTDLQPHTTSVLKSCLEESTVLISNLCVSHNPNLKRGIVHIGSIISHCKTKDVQMSGCYFSAPEIDSFRISLQGYKVERMDLSIQCAIDPSNMIPKSENRFVNAFWNLSPNNLSSNDVIKNQLNAVRKTVIGATQLPMKVELLGNWKKVSAADYVAITNFLIQCVENNLTLYGWKFDEHLRGVFETAMDYLHSGKSVTLSENDIIGTKNSWDSSDTLLHFCELPKYIPNIIIPIDIVWKQPYDYEQFDIVLLYDDDKSTKFQTAKGKECKISTSTSHQKYVLFIVGMPTKKTGGTISGRSEFEHSILNIFWALRKAETLSLKIIINQNAVKLLCSNIDCKLQSANPVQATCQELTTLTTSENLAEKQVMTGFLDGIETPDDMIKKCQEQNVLHWNEIQIAHTNVTISTVDFVSNVISNSSSILEFALRDVNPTTDLLTTILSYVENSCCQIREFSVNCEKNISSLLPVICKILSTCRSNILNMSENDISEEFLRKLSWNLDDTNLVKTLIGLDLSYNTNIQDFSSLADILKKSSIEILRLMNCGIIEEYLQSLTRNISEGKARYNCIVIF